MPHPGGPVPPSTGESSRRFRRHRPPEQVFFSGTYGLVLASTLSAALDGQGERPDPGNDLLWILLTVLAGAAAHGYAHVIAGRSAGHARGPAAAFRTVAAEWPLVAAALPTMAMLLTAYAGWWPEATAVETALTFNTAALFGAGAWSARISGRRWPAAFLAGTLDMALGLLVIVADVALR
ncbi:hypothetical protein ACFPA8_21075 [Streptomyces ovatisporus]|uniref:Integral membrane protein n=1 Tax=Streptomyces ovatisporus TaxID=1128682 RepID=A0ABV9ACN5_9ACTN